MLREETVFGPIRSRRLGNSLGINLLPSGGKICNFDCIYCECGWNKDGLEDKHIPSAEEVRRALDSKLRELQATGNAPDSITFSGDGEPTLNPEFPEIIDDCIRLRDKYFPKAKIAVLSNATRVHIPEVFEALKKVDMPIMKIDAPSDGLAAVINRPAPGYSVNRVVEALKHFNGDFILQTMFLRSAEFDSSSDEVLLPWMDIVRELKPRQIMAYTIARPTPASGLEKFSCKELEDLTLPLVREGFTVNVYC